VLRRLWTVPVLVLILAAMAFAMLSTAVAQTPTIDEPVYITSATVYLREHTVRFNPEHPPLAKLVMAAGLAFARPTLDSGYAESQKLTARHLMYHSGNDPARLLFAARLPIILLTCLFGLVVFAFARDLTNNAGGVLALALYACTPDLITHGALATLDVPAAGFVLTALWLAWRGRDRPLPYAPLAGLALGAAAATRANTLIAVPVVLALVLWRMRGEPRRALAAAAGVGVLAVAVVWLAYLIVDPRLRWTAPDTVPVLHGLRRVAVDLLPFPPAYRDGVRLQFALDAQGADTFLFGRHYHGPVWYYLPAAMLVKTPLGLLVLWPAAAALLLAVPRFRPAAAYLLVTPLMLAAAVAAGNRDYGTRYAVVVPMFGAVAAAVLVTVRRCWVHAATVALALYVATSVAAAYPYFLPYANEAFGGPDQTHRNLHDSNVDWGQDLGRLADRLHTRYRGQRVWLSYKGAGLPAYYGIRSRNPLRAPPDEVRGLLVVSDSTAALAEGRLKELIESSRPIDSVGHSITIYQR
jgi:4-amino-4-deoxy-L-arabinose transferase-like glycosyltransferase